MKPKKILILSANPATTPRLQFDKEIREIEEGLKRAKLRDRFEIKASLAIRIRDLRRAMLDHEPNIVHFIGHGEEDGIFVENEQGTASFVSSEALSGLFELFSKQVECVILGACYSATQADIINQHIKYVIGMTGSVKDGAALEFGVGFFDALGAGRSVEDAYQFGCVAISMVYPDYKKPILKIKPDK